MTGLRKLCCILLVLLVTTTVTRSVLGKAPVAASFDYYVLSLSWSPTYCGSSGGERDRTQCAPGRRFAFVVHGLWPQYDKGWPSDCPNAETWVPEDVIDSMMDIMPSKKLIIHEWRKHGTCSGLPLRSYFKAIRQLRDGLHIPARYLSPNEDIETTPQQMIRDFTSSNRGLTQDMLSVQCGNARDKARLQELRICLDRSGHFASCGENENRRCSAKSLILPRVR